MPSLARSTSSILDLAVFSSSMSSSFVESLATSVVVATFFVDSEALATTSVFVCMALLNGKPIPAGSMERALVAC